MDRAPGLALAIFSSSGPSRGVPSRGEAVRPFRVVYGQRAFELIPPTSAGLPGSVARVSLLLLALGGSVDMSEAGHVVPARDTSAGEEPAVTSVSAEEASERPFPLNSRRLTGPYLMCIAKAMGLPTSGATDATRVMIDGKITEMGRDPRNVQVTVRTHPHGQETLSLRDVDGVFVDAGTTDVVPELEGDSTGSVNNEDVSEGRDLDSPVHSGEDEIADLRAENALFSACTTELKTEVSALNEEVHRLKDRLERETERVNEMWRMNCAQVSGFDEAIIAKDKEIEMLKSKVTESRAPLGRLPMHSTAVTPHPPVSVRSAHIDETPVDTHYTHASGLIRRGKAPPVNEFSGEDPDILLEDWLPSIERASEWNGWSEEDRMIQLAGHLKGRALQEWNLLHLDQRRLERTFQTANGRDKMSVETRDTLLYGQLQEGIRLQLMRGPAVSGAKDYQELCMASKNEEKRLANLKKRQEYAKLQTSTGSSTPRQSNRPGPTMGRSNDHSKSAGSPSSSNFTKPKMTCFYCNRIGHRAQDCRKKKRDLGESESRGPSHPATTKQIRVGEDQSTLNAPSHTSHNPPQLNPSSSSSAVSIVAESCTSIQSPLTLLFSGSESETDDVRQIHITDNGSHSQLARVDVQGVPADGIIDTAADITIIGGKLFALVAATAKLRKKNFRKSDKIPRNYDRRTFHLDGCMEMDITFQDKTMNTTVYIKMDASDQLLLSEGVCRQLGVVSYHPSILAQRVTKKRETTLVPSIRV